MISSGDISWLRNNYPSLNYRWNRIEGRIHFSVSCDVSTFDYIISPDATTILKSGMITYTDDYLIRIDIPADSSIPFITEVDHKLESVSRVRNVKLEDMHVNPNGTFCLASPQAVQLMFVNGFNLEQYVEKLVIPFLFLQTHFSKTGKWLWPTLSHGLSGYLEWYLDHPENISDQEAKNITISKLPYVTNETEIMRLLKPLLRGKYKGHMPCVCGSNIIPKKIRNCCPNALIAINSMRHELITELIDRRKPTITQMNQLSQIIRLDPIADMKTRGHSLY